LVRVDEGFGTVTAGAVSETALEPIADEEL